MTTPTEIILWLDRKAVALDLEREAFVKTNNLGPACVRQVQAKALADAADEIRKLTARVERITP